MIVSSHETSLRLAREANADCIETVLRDRGDITVTKRYWDDVVELEGRRKYEILHLGFSAEPSPFNSYRMEYTVDGKKPYRLAVVCYPEGHPGERAIEQAGDRLAGLLDEILMECSNSVARGSVTPSFGYKFAPGI